MILLFLLSLGNKFSYNMWVKVPKTWQTYASEVTNYLRTTFSTNEFLGKYTLYQLGLVDERGHTEISPKTGKLLRPTLLLLALDGFTGNSSYGIPAAAALEIFHNGTLLIDDWQDGDRQRRGRKALWALPSVGVRQAINVGLFLFSVSSRMIALLDSSMFSPEVNTKAQFLFEEAKIDVIRGQQMDIAYEDLPYINLDDYLTMIELKTARLIQTSLLLGALLGRASEDIYNNISLFGQQLGILFQLQDDYLGLYGNVSTMGKPADDIAHKKKSLPIVLAMQEANEEDKKKLQHIYAQKNILSEKDVALVKTLFEKLTIEKKMREMIEATYQKACKALGKIPDTSFSKKDDLQFLADLFAHREK